MIVDGKGNLFENGRKNKEDRRKNEIEFEKICVIHYEYIHIFLLLSYRGFLDNREGV